MLNLFRRDDHLALPVTETRRPAPEDPTQAPRRPRRPFVIPIVLVGIAALVLVAEKLTGRLASLLYHEILARHIPRWRLFDRAPSEPTTTPDPERGLKVHIQQDVHDAFLLPSKRRIVTTIVTLSILLQFVRVMAVAEPFETTGIVAVLAGVNFAYWLFNEILTHVLRFSSGRLTPANRVVALALAKHHRPNWLFSTPLDAEEAGKAIDAAWVHFFGVFFFVLPLVALFSCVWSICDFTSGLGKDRWAIHFWYALQGYQVVLLVLLLLLRLYDSSRTVKPRRQQSDIQAEVVGLVELIR